MARMGVIKCQAVTWIAVLACGLAHGLISTPAPLNAHPSANYTVTENNVTCVVMAAGIQLSIPYDGPTKDVQLVSDIGVPANSSFNGSCSQTPGENRLNIAFNDNWLLTVVFSNTSKSGDYHWSAVQLHYKLDDRHFPNVSNQTSGKSVDVMTSFPDTTFPFSKGGWFKCATNSLALNNSIQLQMWSLKYTAFKGDDSSTFPKKEADECQEDFQLPPDNIGLITGIGIALLVFIVVLVLGYIIGSRIMDRYRKLES